MDLRATRSDWLPRQIGNYDILEILGMGGMGVIYRAIQKPLNRVVALKVLPPQMSGDNESSLRFESEAKAISMLQHQNIVQMYDYGEENGCRYFTMQYIDGENLAAKIAGKKPMDLAEIVDYSKQVGRGLRYAHSMGIIHRDIKPQNVLIDKKKVARLSDFGIAKLVSQNDITMAGVTVGTPEYMSPEQASGQDLSIQTDVYSMGIVIYEMLTKRPPFLANNPVAVAYKQVHEIPLPPSVLRKDTPKRLELIVLKALKKELSDRYFSVDEMLDNLDSVDINERVGHTTMRFRSGISAPTPKAAVGLSEKRITDRRGGNRRRLGYEKTGPWVIVDPEFWIYTVKQQWLSLCVAVGVGVVLALHLLGKLG